MALQSHDAAPVWESELGGQGEHDISPNLANEPAAQAVVVHANSVEQFEICNNKKFTLAGQ